MGILTLSSRSARILLRGSGGKSYFVVILHLPWGGGQMHRVLTSVSFFLSSDFSITSYPIPVLHDTLTRLLQRNVIIWPAETVCLRPGVLSDDMVSWHLLQGGSDKPLGSGEGNGRKSSQSFNVCLFHKSAPRFDVVLSDVA